MRKFTLALIATVAAASLTSAASAADLLIDQTPTPIVDNSYSGFDWNGAYAGISLSGQTGSIYGLGADLGVNALIDNNLLVGAEGNVTWLNDDSWQGQVHGKLGFASGNFAFYGLLGVGYNTETEAYAPIGVGAELALTDSMSLKAEYQYQYDFNDSSEDAHVAKVGLNWHF